MRKSGRTKCFEGMDSPSNTFYRTFQMIPLKPHPDDSHAQFINLYKHYMLRLIPRFVFVKKNSKKVKIKIKKKHSKCQF